MAAVPPAAPPAVVAPPAGPYVLVDGDVDVVDSPLLTEEETIRQILHWIGFTIVANRDNLMNESIGSLDDVLSLTQKDVIAFSTDWSNRQATAGRFHIGTRRSKLLQAFVHWVQDFQRVSGTVSIVGLNQNTFKEQLRRALNRASIRQNLKDNTSSASEAASPGSLENERKWKTWEEKFTNYCRVHIGSNGIPLSYVIRENDDPNTDGEFGDFITETIECAPLSGEYYLADRQTVFNMLTSFTTGQPSGDWIKSTARHSDGRRSMKQLRDHFSGEGNATRNIAEADRLKETLHYKSERAMPFETFLTQCEKMYNIYDKEGEKMEDDAKIRFLFKNIQHSDLKITIAALKTRMIDTNITYTEAANHIATAVSELPEYIAKNRNISGVGTTTDTTKGSSNIRKPDGTIITGHIPNWRSLSQADRAIVYAERERLGLNKNKRGNKNANGSNTNAESNRSKQLAEQNKKLKRQIKALKRSTINNDDTTNNDDNSNGDATDAGDQFGGKNSKKSKKK